MRILLVACLLTLAPSCASPAPERPAATTPQSSSPTKPTAAPPFAGLWRDPHDPRVLGWVSSPWTFSTTSWAIEGDDGLILIDTQFLPSDAIAFVDAVEGATGKEAKLAVVLHANPDKFNGTAALQARGIRVVTSSQVNALIPAVHEKRFQAFGARYAPDYPTTAARPESFGSETTTLSIAGIALRLQPTGPGCSAAHVIASFDDDTGSHVFAGDLLANGSHAWLEIGEPVEWQKRLVEIGALKPAFLHPGRGLTGDGSLLASQQRYLDDVTTAVSQAVAQAEAVGGADDAIIEGARERVLAKHPDLRFSVFLNIGLPALVAKEKAGAASAPRR